MVQGANSADRRDIHARIAESYRHHRRGRQGGVWPENSLMLSRGVRSCGTGNACPPKARKRKSSILPVRNPGSLGTEAYSPQPLRVRRDKNPFYRGPWKDQTIETGQKICQTPVFLPLRAQSRPSTSTGSETVSDRRYRGAYMERLHSGPGLSGDDISFEGTKRSAILAIQKNPRRFHVGAYCKQIIITQYQGVSHVLWWPSSSLEWRCIRYGDSEQATGPEEGDEEGLAAFVCGKRQQLSRSTRLSSLPPCLSEASLWILRIVSVCLCACFPSPSPAFVST